MKRRTLILKELDWVWLLASLLFRNLMEILTLFQNINMVQLFTFHFNLNHVQILKLINILKIKSILIGLMKANQLSSHQYNLIITKFMQLISILYKKLNNVNQNMSKQIYGEETELWLLMMKNFVLQP